MGFFENIRRGYGSASVDFLKQWANFNIKLASLNNRRIFLLKCRRNLCFPVHIENGKFNVNNLLHHKGGKLGSKIQNFNSNLKTKILNLEISVTISDITYIEKNLHQLKNILEQHLPAPLLQEFYRRQKIKYNKVFFQIRNNNIKKFNKIKIDQFSKITFQEKWFKNLTDITFPYNVKKLLSLGPKFCLFPSAKDFKMSSLLSDIEFLISGLELQEKDIMRSQSTNVITNFLHKTSKEGHFLNNIYNECKQFLKSHLEIYIVRSDKGNVTVAMYKNDYIEKSNSLLNDKKSYIELRNSPVCTLQQKANKLVSDLASSKSITTEAAKSLKIYNAVAPRFYTLPKVHKPTISMRPIVSSIDAPNSKLAKHLTDILTISYNESNEFYIRDSFTFSNFINNVKVPNNYILISLDVVSLFTNLPLDAILNSIKNNWNSISLHTKISLEDFIRILTFIFDSNIFLFNGNFFKQIFGTPMGSKISPILCNFVLDELITTCKEKIPFHIPFIKRYVDDLILSVPENKVSDVLNTFNAQCEHLKFTVEREADNMIPFLDMLIHRGSDGILRTEWYRKPCFSNRFINFHSQHPSRMKTNLVLALKSRVTNLSHIDFRDKGLKKLRSILLENSYPIGLLNKLIFGSPFPSQFSGKQNFHNNEVRQLTLTDSDNTSVIPPKITFGSLPYIPVLTPKLINIFRNVNGLKISTRNVKTVSKLYSKTKDPFTRQESSNVVYSIPCSNCNNVYIGETSRNFHTR
ncbi:uncharacterized protein LOC126884882 [Diabrotica virgifera virgifera]|uniref:Reverse transcriptase domain-containing protein n=1 Tax=Diabrotica virgifera virgifera TaxID=50390 RepID=A0ABM5KAC9_DIAVI|nr:uncharacterized protein LOC126884882 [Diabrotica virgifera virgifera]